MNEKIVQYSIFLTDTSTKVHVQSQLLGKVSQGYRIILGTEHIEADKANGHHDLRYMYTDENQNHGKEDTQSFVPAYFMANTCVSASLHVRTQPTVTRVD